MAKILISVVLGMLMTITVLEAKENGYAVLTTAQLRQQLTSQLPDEQKQRISDELEAQDEILAEVARLQLEGDKQVKTEIELARRKVLVQAYWQYFFKRNPVQESDAREVYNQLRQLNGDKQYRLSQIVVSDEGAARKVLDALKDRNSFAKLAKEMSLDATTAQQGGDLGWRWKSDLVPEFRRVVDLLEKGEYTTPPVALANGYVILTLDGVRQQTFPGFEKLRSHLMKILGFQAQQMELRRIRKKSN
ncbi:peptidylprolyl isomerase [Emcibacter nanhaiensis]|nr:peptidylprolyl isomerase [Emcibacter nanhaiensis]